MKIQKQRFLKSCGYIGIIASVLLIMSLVVAGCTQTSTDNSGPVDSGCVPNGCLREQRTCPGCRFHGTGQELTRRVSTPEEIS